jgi:assimilatory nitrate reductase catalytic subunit
VSRHPIDRLVQTHCCFCGQQCGIQLKVRGNQVVGFEPWEEFPFNRGMLCPKGVRRYLQGNHADRLLDPLLRGENGFEKTSWDEALDRTVARLREIQEKHGKDAVAVYGGASLTSEKSYLLGKFARVALGTRHIDYNGLLSETAQHRSPPSPRCAPTRAQHAAPLDYISRRSIVGKRP